MIIATILSVVLMVNHVLKAPAQPYVSIMISGFSASGSLLTENPYPMVDVGDQRNEPNYRNLTFFWNEQ